MMIIEYYLMVILMNGIEVSLIKNTFEECRAARVEQMHVFSMLKIKTHILCQPVE